MRSQVLVCLLSTALASGADYSLYTCMVTSRDYVVGAKLPPSGIFVRPPSGAWRHVGFNHPNITALDVDPHSPSDIYMAAGNGLTRATRDGKQWTILTGHDVTELRDLAVDRNAPGTLYFAHSAGVRVTRDGGRTWQDATGARKRRYTESVRVDRTHAGRLLAGGEDGLYLSEDAGKSWQLTGAAGFSVMHIEQSPHDACLWLAVTQMGGIFASKDCGKSFENFGKTGVGRNLYDISFDPSNAGRIAIGGFGPGVVVSEDGGKTWHARNAGLPSTEVWSVAFDPGNPGRLYASVHEEALYVSQDSGKSWVKEGLEGSAVYRMVFLPEGAAH